MSDSGYLKRSHPKGTTSVEVSLSTKYSNWSDLVARIAELETANKRLAGQLANHKLLPGVVQASDLANGLDALWIAWAEKVTP